MKSITCLLLLVPAVFASAQGSDSSEPVTQNDSINVFISQADQTPRLVLRGADGTFPAVENLDSDNSIKMTYTPDGYIAEDVEITTGGFLFYAPLPDDKLPQEQWKLSYYKLADWAVKPLLLRYLNPLYHLMTGQTPEENYIAIDNGTYDIRYFTRKQQESVADQFYELFSIVDASDPDPSNQPPEMYLVNMYNEATAVSETKPGHYEARVLLPDEEFKICYESAGYYIPAFAFGPAKLSETALEGGKLYNLVYGWNTYHAFTYATDVKNPKNLLHTGDEALVTIDFNGEAPTLNINGIDGGPVTGTESPGVTPDADTPEYYTAGGLRIDRPSSPGLYIVRHSDGTVEKAVRY